VLPGKQREFFAVGLSPVSFAVVLVVVAGVGVSRAGILGLIVLESARRSNQPSLILIQHEPNKAAFLDSSTV
jgi:hypothetical protein